MIQSGTTLVPGSGRISIRFPFAFESLPDISVFPVREPAGTPEIHLSVTSVSLEGFDLSVTTPVLGLEVGYIACSRNSSSFVSPAGQDNAGSYKYKDTLNRTVREVFSNFCWNYNNGEQMGFGFREALVSVNVWAGVLQVRTPHLIGVPPTRVVASGETYNFVGYNDPNVHPVFSLGFLALSNRVHGCWSIKGIELPQPVTEQQE